MQAELRASREFTPVTVAITFETESEARHILEAASVYATWQQGRDITLYTLNTLLTAKLTEALKS